MATSIPCLDSTRYFIWPFVKYDVYFPTLPENAHALRIKIPDAVTKFTPDMLSRTGTKLILCGIFVVLEVTQNGQTLCVRLYIYIFRVLFTTYWWMYTPSQSSKDNFEKTCLHVYIHSTLPLCVLRTARQLFYPSICYSTVVKRKDTVSPHR